MSKKPTQRKITPHSIKQNISPRDFYSFEIPNLPAKAAGWNKGGLCPFHSDKQPGSYWVNVTTGAFNCFSCGTKGGDIIAYTMALYQLTFPDALIKIGKDWGFL